MLVTAGISQILSPLIDVFQAVLQFFHNSGGISWGLSIVLLTIAVRAVLIPLTFRQIKSMVRMQGLQPQMKAIQQKYKQDKQRQQEEIMKFYRENNVNPLGSCLPLLLQLPVFVSLYYMLRESLRNDICPGIQATFRQHYYLKHHLSSVAAAHSQTTACGVHAAGAHFLFVNDLTAKASGVELVILIVLYIGSQLGSTLVMSAASMDPTQRKIMMFMPLIFVLFVIRFPAGLLLYWITTNLWTVAQQYTVKRYIGPMQAAVGSEVAVAGAGGAVTEGGNGSRSGGGGMGARLRDRLFSAQERALAAQRERQAEGGSGGGAGKSPAKPGSSGGRSGAKADSGAGGAGNGASRAGTGAKAATGSAPKETTRGRRRSGSSNGGGASDGAASNGGGGNGSGTPPPRSPRKKKKRSGRRR